LDVSQHREKPGNAADYRYFSSHARRIGIPCESGRSQLSSYEDPARGELEHASQQSFSAFASPYRYCNVAFRPFPRVPRLQIKLCLSRWGTIRHNREAV
jgi:hypothetical protein